MSKNTGIPYEILTQQIFQSLCDLDNVKTINVQQNVKLQGKTIAHQIDVYWEYEIAGVLYKTVIQAKDWKAPVTQAQLLTFKGVLEDLPGQPRGIFVTRTGYQSGAEQFAKGHGIALYELREAAKEDLVDTISTLKINLKALMPSTSNVEPIIDHAWWREECKKQFIPENEIPNIQLCKREDELLLCDTHGNIVGSFRSVILGMFPADYNELPEQMAEHLFKNPTFMLTDDLRFPRLKLIGIRAKISVHLFEQIMIFNVPDFTGFILRDVIGNTKRFVDKPNDNHVDHLLNLPNQTHNGDVSNP